MKRMKKIFVLFTMLIAGLSFKNANNVEKNVVADAADADPIQKSSATLRGNWKQHISTQLSSQGFGLNDDTYKSITITNDASKKPTNDYVGSPVDVDNSSTDSIINAYVFLNTTGDTTMFDCIIYTDVDIIYVSSGSGSHLFSQIHNAVKVTIDCQISMKNVTSMSSMFFNDYKLETIEGLTNIIDTENVTNMAWMFTNCHALESVDVSGFNTSNVTDMSSMFAACKKLTTLDVSSFDTSNVTTMSSMFSNCENLTTIKGLNSEKFVTSKVTNMGTMFNGCDNISTLDVSNFDTSNVTNMRNMFSSCDKLTTIKGLNSGKFDTSKVTNMKSMFGSCYALTTLDLSNFDLSAIPASTDATNPNLLYFVSSDGNLTEIKVPKNMNGLTIQLPYNFGITEIDPSMEGWTLLKGSKEFNTLYNALMKINVCTEYAQAPELQTLYDGLSSTEKDKLATLTDDGGVILTDKLSYMVSYADYKANEVMTASGTHLVLSAKTSQYLVIVIACLSLSLIGGYYFIQKKKYAK